MASNRFEDAAARRGLGEDPAVTAHRIAVKARMAASVQEQHRRAAVEHAKAPSGTPVERLFGEDAAVVTREFVNYMGRRPSTPHAIGLGFTGWRVGRTVPKNGNGGGEGALYLCSDGTLREGLGSGYGPVRDTQRAEFGEVLKRDHNFTKPDGTRTKDLPVEDVWQPMRLEQVLQRVAETAGRPAGR